MPYGEEDIEALDGTDNFEDDELKDIPSPILDLLYPLEAPSASGGQRQCAEELRPYCT